MHQPKDLNRCKVYSLIVYHAEGKDKRDKLLCTGKG